MEAYCPIKNSINMIVVCYNRSGLGGRWAKGGGGDGNLRILSN